MEEVYLHLIWRLRHPYLFLYYWVPDWLMCELSLVVVVGVVVVVVNQKM
jgi:hypothetical protein